jgi:drug/metabolite transporter (DMT)-like permease
VRQPLPADGTRRLPLIGPALVGAVSFACADVLTKVTLREGDVLTVATLRGIIGIAILFLWLQFTRPRKYAISPRARWIALGLGALFAANVFLVFKAIEAVDVPVAILTYFVYPLLTGLAAAAVGLEPLTWRGALTSVVAFLGLALMIGAHPAGVALSGIVAALAGACFRVMQLLVTRAAMQGVDAVAITWYSLISSTVLLGGAALLSLSWQPPVTVAGWIAVIALSISVMMGILGIYASTTRIGPFRTALFMNLEPLLTTIGSALFLNEVITPLQGLGGAVMIAALTLFQLRR